MTCGNQTITGPLVEMADQQQRLMFITLQQRLKDTQPTDEKATKEGNLVEMVGGPRLSGVAADTVPSAANLSYYANIVYEKFLLRS